MASIAHAVQDAIGVTQEYDLQLFTRRSHAWRIAHGSESFWQAFVGKAMFASGLPMVEFLRSTATAQDLRYKKLAPLPAKNVFAFLRREVAPFRPFSPRARPGARK